MFKNTTAFLIVTGIVFFAASHGEDKPGPHGGHIRMPANFHTEVVADQDGSFHVYLLDIKFQNPVVEKSEIRAHIISEKKKKYVLKCSVMNQDHFHCVPRRIVKSGELIIKAKRAGIKASMDAKYSLPLQAFDGK